MSLDTNTGDVTGDRPPRFVSALWKTGLLVVVVSSAMTLAATPAAYTAELEEGIAPASQPWERLSDSTQSLIESTLANDSETVTLVLHEYESGPGAPEYARYPSGFPTVDYGSSRHVHLPRALGWVELALHPAPTPSRDPSSVCRITSGSRSQHP